VKPSHCKKLQLAGGDVATNKRNEQLLREGLRSLTLRKVGVGEVDWYTFKQLRVSLGLTQSEVAGLLGVDRSALTSWERRTKTPTREHAAAVATILDEMQRLSREMAG
jgi:DNA-binding transcriptional regulator YiaG